MSDENVLDIRMDELMNRNEYIVSQGNELAKAMGGLNKSELNLLDFCLSYIKSDDSAGKEYLIEIADILTYYGKSLGGKDFKDVTQTFKKLNENSSIYLLTEEDGVETLVMANWFESIKIQKNGRIKIKYSPVVEPYIFNLIQNFFTFTLAELSSVKSKYTLILMRLLEAKRYGKSKNVELDYSLDEWKLYMLGKEVTDDKVKNKQWTAKRFKQQALKKAVDEMNEKINVDVTLITIKKGKVVVGYKVQLIENRQYKLSPNGR